MEGVISTLWGPTWKYARTRAGDREALFNIGADTAFFGAPIEAYMEDRRTFLDAFYAYYTDYEPQHAWVACVNHQVVGFLTGCTDTPRQEKITRSKLVPAVAWNVLRGRYKLGPKAWRYTRAILAAGLRGEFPRQTCSVFQPTCTSTCWMVFAAWASAAA